MTKSILITGCSSGIGRDAAMTLRARGWRVFATCRAEADAAVLSAEGMESLALDHADPDSIKAALDEVLARTGGTLDAVFLNGAYAIPGAVEDFPRDALRAIFEANLFGPFDVIRRILPVMRAQGHGRIVNCSSVLGFAALRYRGAYIGTKFAMEGMTDTLRLELRGTGIHAILIQPGPIATMIRVKSRPHFERWIDWERSARRAEYDTILRPRLYAEDGPKDRFELPASAVTTALIAALEDARPRARYRVTFPTRLLAVLKRLLPTRTLDAVLARR